MAGLDDRPRDGAHVVRRPRHDEVVGGLVAQRVVRRLHGLRRRRRRRRLHRRVDLGRDHPQADRLPRRPAPLDAPDRRGHREDRRRRHRLRQLRHDHLRQGQRRARASSATGSARRTSSPGSTRYLDDPRASATPTSPTSSTPSTRRPTSTSARGREAWLRTTGFDTLGRDPRAADVPVLTREGSRPHRLTVSAYDDAMRLRRLPRRAPRRRAGPARGVRRDGSWCPTPATRPSR